MLTCYGCIPPTSWRRINLHWRKSLLHQANHQQYLLQNQQNLQEAEPNHQDHLDDFEDGGIHYNPDFFGDVEGVDDNEEYIPQQHVYYQGPIPDDLRIYHEQNPQIRQSPSTLNGQIDCEEHSQYYIMLQYNEIL